MRVEEENKELLKRKGAIKNIFDIISDVSDILIKNSRDVIFLFFKK